MYDINELVKQPEIYRRLSFKTKLHLHLTLPFLPQMYEVTSIDDFFKNKEEIDAKLAKTISHLAFVAFNNVKYEKLTETKGRIYEPVNELEVSLKGYNPKIIPVNGAKVRWAVTIYNLHNHKNTLCQIIANDTPKTKASFFEQLLLGYAELKLE